MARNFRECTVHTFLSYKVRYCSLLLVCAAREIIRKSISIRAYYKEVYSVVNKQQLKRESSKLVQ